MSKCDEFLAMAEVIDENSGWIDIQHQNGMKIYLAGLEPAFMYPYFGYHATRNNREHYVFINNKLDEDEMEFVMKHEVCHVFDKWQHPILRELKANYKGIIAAPLGFFKLFWKTLKDPKRIYLYVKEM